MGATSNYGIPYAELNDPPHGPNQQEALAGAVDIALANVEAGLDSRVSDLETATHARYYQAAAQTVPDATDTPIVFDVAHATTPAISASGGFDTFTFQKAGVWQINASCRILSNIGPGERYMGIVMSSNWGYRYADTNSSFASMACSTSRRFNVGDQITILLFQDTGAGTNTDPVFQEHISVAFQWEGA